MAQGVAVLSNERGNIVTEWNFFSGPILAGMIVYGKHYLIKLPSNLRLSDPIF
jgi:hypothetical protein